jgi:hypothetical protein
VEIEEPPEDSEVIAIAAASAVREGGLVETVVAIETGSLLS